MTQNRYRTASWQHSTAASRHENMHDAQHHGHKSGTAPLPSLYEHSSAANPAFALGWEAGDWGLDLVPTVSVTQLKYSDRRDHWLAVWRTGQTVFTIFCFQKMFKITKLVPKCFILSVEHYLIEKSIISHSAKDTALGSMIELSLGYYGHHKRKNNGIVHDFQTHFKSSLFTQLTCS